MTRFILKAFLATLFLTVVLFISNAIIKIVSTTAPDFRLFWLAARYLQEGKNLYFHPDIQIPIPYPPVTYIYYLPLTFLSYQYAQAIFIFSIFVSIVITIFLSLWAIFKKISPGTFVLAFSLTFLSFPAKFSLGMGQGNTIAYLFLLLCYLLWRKKHSALSGIFLAVSVSLKPVLGFFLLFFVFKKAWRLIYFFLLAIFCEAVFVYIVAGASLFISWAQQLAPYLTLSGREVYYNQGLAGFISRLPIGAPLAKYLTLAGSLALFSAALIVVKKGRSKNLIFSFFTITVLLLDSLSWQHHFVWLVFPFILIAGYAARIKKFWFWILLTGAYLLVSWNFKNPSLYQTFPKALLLSNQFYAALILWWLNFYLLLKKEAFAQLQG